MEAEDRPRSDADSVPRNSAKHQRAGRYARPVDNDTLARVPDLREEVQIVADPAAWARQDAHIRNAGKRVIRLNPRADRKRRTATSYRSWFATLEAEPNADPTTAIVGVAVPAAAIVGIAAVATITPAPSTPNPTPTPTPPIRFCRCAGGSGHSGGQRGYTDCSSYCRSHCGDAPE